MSITYSPPEPETLVEFVADEIRAAMGRRRMSQAVIAASLGMTQQTFSRRLQGKPPFTIEELGEVAVILSVPLRTLLPAHDEDALRLSREADSAGQGQFSGSDMDALLDAVPQQRHAAVA